MTNLKTILLLISFSITPWMINAYDKEEEEENKLKNYQNSISSTHEKGNLKNLIDSDPNLKTHYNSCMTNDENNLSNCLWGKVKNDSTLKTKVLDAIEADKKTSSKNLDCKKIGYEDPAKCNDINNSDKNISPNRENTVTINKEKDIFVQKLEMLINKEFKKIFTTEPDIQIKDSKGEDVEISKHSKRNYLAVDHGKFYELYDSHLSNSIIQSMSSFCSETEFDLEEKKFFIYKDNALRKKSLEKNVKLLEGAKLLQPAPEYKQYCVEFKDSKNPSVVSEGLANCPKFDPCNSNGPLYDETSCRFNSCIPSINKLCYDTNSNISSSAKADDKTYTQTRACEVMEFVKSARSAIIELKKTDKVFEGRTGNNVTNLELRGLKEFKSEEGVKRDSQDIVTVSSKVFKEADEFTKGLIENDGCLDKNGNILDEKRCSNLLINNKDEAETAVIELSLKRDAQVDSINKLENIEEIKKFLKKETIDKSSDEQNIDLFIESVTKEIANDPTKDLVETLKAKISDKYREESKAIINGLTSKIKENTISSDDTNSSRAEKIKKIKEELSHKGERYTNMIHYSNIVSSYLSITDSKSGKSDSNTNQLFKELNSRKDLATSKKLLENAKNAGLKKNEDSSSTTLDINLINKDILDKYD